MILLIIATYLNKSDFQIFHRNVAKYVRQRVELKPLNLAVKLHSMGGSMKTFPCDILWNNVETGWYRANAGRYKRANAGPINPVRHIRPKLVYIICTTPDSRPTLGQRWQFTLGQRWQRTLGLRHFARWPIVGPTCWPNVGPTLANYNQTLANYNPTLAQRWLNVGPTLDQCWANVGLWMCHRWPNIGSMLGQRWLNVWPTSCYGCVPPLAQCWANVGL